MKRQLAIALGLAVVSVPAMASKARLEALGQSATGSQYIDDNRNVFLNSATLNYNKDYVTMELGDTKANADSDTAPRAEGGFFKASGSMNYGLYLGHERNTSNLLRAAVSTDAELEENDTMTLFFAGDAGVQWGANLFIQNYSSKSSGTKKEASAMALGLGVISGDIEGFLNLGLGNKAKIDGGAEFAGKSSMDLGVTYNMDDLAIMGRMTNVGGENKGNSDDIKLNVIKVGAAKSWKLNDKAKLWASGWYSMTERKCKGTTFSTTLGQCNDKGVKESNIPVTISLEATATEWLTLRGNVTQKLPFMNSTDNGTNKGQGKDSTSVGLGASLTYGDLSVDGTVNTAGAGGGAMNIDQPLHRLSVTYKF